MRVICDEIWWDTKDMTDLPTIAVLNIEPEETPEEFFEAVEDALYERHGVYPKGFNYEIVTETLQ